MKSSLPVILRAGLCADLLCGAICGFAANPPAGAIALRGEFSCGVERRLALPYSGTIAALTAEVGQAVKQGDVLMRYELDARAEMEWSQAVSPAAAFAAEADLAAAESEADLADAAVREAERLAEQKLVSVQQQDQARRNNEVARARRKAARERAELERQQLEGRHAQLAELAGPAGKGAAESHSWEIQAPLDGVVIWLAGALRPGSAVEAGVPVAVLGVMDPMILRAHVHELEAVKLKVGDTAEIQPLALPGLALQGTVSRIAWAPVPHNLPEPSYYELEIVVSNADHAIHPGYKADILFHPAR